MDGRRKIVASAAHGGRTGRPSPSTPRATTSLPVVRRVDPCRHRCDPLAPAYEVKGRARMCDRLLRPKRSRGVVGRSLALPARIRSHRVETSQVSAPKAILIFDHLSRGPLRTDDPRERRIGARGCASARPEFEEEVSKRFSRVCRGDKEMNKSTASVRSVSIVGVGIALVAQLDPKQACLGCI